MGMLLAMTMMEQEKARKQAEMPVEASSSAPMETPAEPEAKAVETAKKPVKRATGRKPVARRKTSK